MSDTSANPSQSPLRVSSPSDVLAVIPYLLGFHPADSLVVLGLGGRRLQVRFTARMELPAAYGHDGDGSEDDAADLAAYVAGVVTAQHVREAILVAYGPRSRADRAVELTKAELNEREIGVREMLRAHEGRYWSYTCTDPSCCPPEGSSYDVRSSPVAAAATVAGHVALPDRETLERSIAPVGGVARVSMQQATERAESRLERWAAGCPGTAALKQHLVGEGSARVRDTLERFRGGDGALSDDDTAWLGVLLTQLQVRDEAWLLIDEHSRAAHLSLWTHVVRRAEEPYVPAPACLLAFTAWQLGNGTLASIAVQRAQAAEPEYSMARLMGDVLASGIPPSSWRPPVRPEDLPGLYARTGRGTHQ